MTALLVGLAMGLLILATRPRRVEADAYLGVVPVAMPRRRRTGTVPAGSIWGAGVGLLAGSTSPERLPALVLLGLLGGALAARAARSTRRQRRSRRLAQELPTVADTLALHVLAGESVTGAIRRVAAACNGVAADELNAAATDPDGLETGLRRAATSTSHPEGARLYELLGHAHRTGGRLSDSLRELATDFRAALTTDLTAEGGRRALASYGPILPIMIPVTLVFLMYPTLAGLSALSATPMKEGNVPIIHRLNTEERGVTTVEWLGMAAIAVLVIAVLLPQVRSAANNLWNSIVGQLTGFFA